MVTQEIAAEKILDYLNGRIELAALVHWAEDALFSLSEADESIPNEKLLMRILGYIGAGDSVDFPLTWEVLSEFLTSLGVKTLRVEAS
jgi:hypothetical protein